jgi:predicted AAA+ superfamily ATPase
VTTSTTLHKVLSTLKNHRFDLTREKQTQIEVNNALLTLRKDFKREFILDKENIIDFYFPEDGIGIEVKLKFGAMQTLKQCERYCGFDQIKTLILLTRTAHGFPPQIKGKDVYLVSLGEAWL